MSSRQHESAEREEICRGGEADREIEIPTISKQNANSSKCLPLPGTARCACWHCSKGSRTAFPNGAWRASLESPPSTMHWLFPEKQEFAVVHLPPQKTAISS